MGNRHLKHIGFGCVALRRKIASDFGGAIDKLPLRLHGLDIFSQRHFGKSLSIWPRKGQYPRDGMQVQPVLQFGRVKIQLIGRQGLVMRVAGVGVQRHLTVFKMIPDGGETLGHHLARAIIQNKWGRANIIQQAVQFLMKQRQPVLHAGIAPPLAHGFIKLVAARHAAKGRDIGLTKAAHGLSGELHLTHRHKV